MKINNILLAFVAFMCFTNNYALECKAGGKVVYEFKNLDTTHEAIYCTIHDDIPNTKQIILYNESEMSSGFDVRGTLRADKMELDKYYIDNFHDTNPIKMSKKGYICANTEYTIACHAGQGGRNERFPGTYG